MRHYFFGATNPAELRGTGGYLGAYSILTVDDGVLSFTSFTAPYTLPQFDDDDIPPPNDAYGRRYSKFGGTGFWPNINMTPDFPTAAVAIQRLYTAGTGKTVDGVILADPQMLAALLQTTGPTDVPGVGQINAGNVTEVVSVTASETFGIERNLERKNVLGAVAAGVVQKFLSGGGSNPAAAGRALASAAGDGHLLLYSNDEAEQAAFEQARVSGRLVQSRGDYLGVFGNNASATKLDFFMDREVEYDVSLGSGGSAATTAVVALRNDAPTSGFGPYVIGPAGLPSVDLRAGENFTYLSVFCGAKCALRNYEGKTLRKEVVREAELDHRVFSTWETSPPGGHTTATYQLDKRDAWRATDAGGIYQLVFQTQPMIRPTKLTVRVTAPAGMRISSASDGMSFDEHSAVWEGDAHRLEEMTVTFSRPPRDAVKQTVSESMNWWASLLGVQ